VLITGASSGIGEAIGKRLLEEGWKVYGAARRVERLKGLEDKGASVIRLDVTDDGSMKSCANAVLAKEGRIDALINNAGYGSYGAIEDVPLNEARRQFEVNVFGLARMAQLVLPAMREQRSGRIVNISSMGGKLFTPMGGWYHATKHAVEALSDALRLEAGLFGINVIIIVPGVIHSEWPKIAVDNLIKVSGKTAYARLAGSMVSAIKNSYKSRGAVGPDVIAKVVSKALKAKNPKARYVAPIDAKILLFLWRILPDRVFDNLLRSALKLPENP